MTALDRLFRLVRQEYDKHGNRLRVFIGPCLRIESYSQKGINTENDEVYYIQTAGRYRFSEDDLDFLLTKYIGNLQFLGEKARAKLRFKRSLERC